MSNEDFAQYEALGKASDSKKAFAHVIMNERVRVQTGKASFAVYEKDALYKLEAGRADAWHAEGKARYPHEPGPESEPKQTRETVAKKVEHDATPSFAPKPSPKVEHDNDPED